ncbi:hypothetical protein BSLG_002202 [Batrachochytrium salamandrivorans]|nr:hypothetical protein BSLG_002202 [Batrachochytrium salamandrivorans]
MLTKIYYLLLRLNPSGFQSFDRAVRTSHPHYADMLVDPNSLHVTLLHMELTSKQYAKAFSILEHFQSVSDFGPHILFAKLVPNDAFRVCKLADTLRSHFIRAGFSLLDKPQFVPHCTVIKTYLHDKHSHETIDYSLGVMYADFDFAINTLDNYPKVHYGGNFASNGNSLMLPK